MLSQHLRNTVLVFWAMVLVGIAAVLHLGLVFSNYITLVQSFELIGFERKPLADAQFVGPFFSVLAPEATIADLWGALVALVVALGLFVVGHHTFRLILLARERKQYLAAQDEQNASAAKEMMVSDAIILLLFLLPLIPLLAWDMDLFRFRWAAYCLGIEDPTQAVAQIKDWGLQLREKQGLFAWSIGSLAPYAYISVLVLAGLFLEHRMHRMSESWARLWSPFEGPTPQQQFYGYDVDGQPVYDPNSPIAYDVDGNPVSSTVEEPAAKPSTEPQGPQGVPEPAHDQPTESNPQQEESLRGVIGGSEHDRVSLEQALADPSRYWVDEETREIWDAEYHRRLAAEEEFANK